MLTILKKENREEARQIETLRKRILEVSGKEEPYDIFISYKELDEDGERTIDSVIAQNIYKALVKEGYRVFFSRISLEGKLGIEYEPYIFAALNSAKVMIVVGTDYEYFNAVWVKNEWSRFLKLISDGQQKTLIPVYKDMDPYDMPKELRNLAAQNMGKIGAMQDLLHGVEKLIPIIIQTSSGADHDNLSVSINQTFSNPSLDSLLRRAFVFLEDRDWEKADEYADRVLDIDAANGNAYLVKMLAELHVGRESELEKLRNPISNSLNWQRILRYGNVELRDRIKKYNQLIIDRLEAEKHLEFISNTKKLINQAYREKSIIEIKKQLPGILTEEESTILLDDCDKVLELIQDNTRRKAEIATKRKAIEPGIKNIRNDYIKRNSEFEAQQTSIAEITQQLRASQDEKIKLVAELKALQSEYQNLHGLFSNIRKKDIETQHSAKKRKLIETETIIEKTEKALLEAKEKASERPSEDEMHYMAAQYYYKERLFEDAYHEFKLIENYKDVPTLLATDRSLIIEAAREAKIGKYKVTGSIVTFGEYPINDETGGSKELIEWIVIDHRDNQSMLLCKNALDCQPYNLKAVNTTWEKSSLRNWLNTSFFDGAFDRKQQNAIVTTAVDNSYDQGNHNWRDNGSKLTTDRVFLLSYKEAENYFTSNKLRICKATTYAMRKGVSVDSLISCLWWLRSPGFDSMSAARVDKDGTLGYSNIVDYTRNGVRPVIWVNIDDDYFN